MKTEEVGQSILETWTVDEVAEAFSKNQIVLIDVRTPQEYMFEHVEGALLMPLAFFKADKLPASRKSASCSTAVPARARKRSRGPASMRGSPAWRIWKAVSAHGKARKSPISAPIWRRRAATGQLIAGRSGPIERGAP